MSTMMIELAPKLIPLFAPARGDLRYRVMKGGRGSAKSFSAALMAAIWGAIEPLRILCTRQYQNSIKESFHAELKHAIASNDWLASVYDVGIDYLRHKTNGTVFIFQGLQRNIESIKSMAQVDLVIVEEAETVPHHSWHLLLPTIRAAKSEFWIIYNPVSRNSWVAQTFDSKELPPRTKVVHVNWTDNPWFPPELNEQRLHQQKTWPEDLYNHVWEGAYGIVAGSILGRWISQARKDKRITKLEYDTKGAPIIISSDIGFHDTASWWYWQPVLGGFNLLKYDGDSGLDADDWAQRIKEKLAGLDLGFIYLPHDARAKTFQSKHSSLERFIKNFGADKVRIVPISRKNDQINAARNILPRCAFNELECEAGISGLENWRFEWNEDTQQYSKNPLHDLNSHPADAFCYGAQVLGEFKPEPKIEDAKYAMIGTKHGTIRTAPLETLWPTEDKRTRY